MRTLLINQCNERNVEKIPKIIAKDKKFSLVRNMVGGSVRWRC